VSRSDPPPFATSLRTHLAGELRETHVGQTVTVGGWVHRVRNMGALVFIDLRDRGGLVQVSFDPSYSSPEALEIATSVTSECVVRVTGEVAARPADKRNSELASGAIEVRAHRFILESAATPPAIPVARGKDENLPAEENRLRYRYLDLRRPELRQNLVRRHALMQAARRHLSDLGFLEVETPILTKPTPEGARDYLVPSRVHPGEFYALPQSPQIYKQLLMVSGFDRYFQIARCFRDEDLRADRQPEFTQIDIEAAFVQREDILAVGEGLMQAIWQASGVSGITRPFPHITYRDAMERYGSDRPDLRYELAIVDATALFRASDFGIARSAIDDGGRVRGLVAPGGASLSRKQVDEIESLAKHAGARGLIRLKQTAGGLEGPAAKFLPSGAAQQLGLRDGDLCLLVAARDRDANPALDRVRQELARRLSLVREGEHCFLWVIDFPLFARDPDTGGIVPEHHPFTAPHPDDVGLLDSDPAAARSLAYDTVYNGFELSSGSIRIHDPRLQSRIFTLLGIDEASANTRFGFLLEGLRSGAPPHGGIAFGFDRIAMLLAGAGSLRDVIAFPKTTAARALFEGAPSPVMPHDLEALHITVKADPA
jgi:aspartyl-tRNA synthetase